MRMPTILVGLKRDERRFLGLARSVAVLISLLLLQPVEASWLRTNLPYCGGGSRVLDIAVPDGYQTFPAIVFIHGGGWKDGDKEAFLPAIQFAAEQGFVGVAINYRLTGEEPWPAQINDVKCAVRWLRAKAWLHKINSKQIAALGTSAGGHLALLLGFTEKSDGLEGNGGYSRYSSKVNSVSTVGGPTDLRALYEYALAVGDWDGIVSLEQFLGGSPETAYENYLRASPTSYLRPSNSPVIVLHGGADARVPLSQAEQLSLGLANVEVHHQPHVYPGAGHDLGIPDDPAQTAENQFDAFLRSLDFFRETP